MTDIQLVVLAGAKEGTRIPLKKSKFLIGRADECALRASSGAISRRHCALIRTKEGWVARDLGSRNGTHVNGKRIESPTRLSVGDELEIGPLKFRVEARSQAAPGAKSGDSSNAATSGSSQAARSPGKASKSPPAKETAERPRRPSDASGASATEEDITRWLLGPAEDAPESDVLRETRSLSMEDTTAVSPSPSVAAPDDDDEDAEDIVVAEDAEDQPAAPTEEAPDADNNEKESQDDSGGWKLFKFGKNRGDKKKPGRLPHRPDQDTRDSREAAADILREMTRRR